MVREWITSTCGIDNCGAKIGAKSPSELAREVDKHRKSFHPRWTPPPDKRRLQLPDYRGV